MHCSSVKLVAAVRYMANIKDSSPLSIGPLARLSAAARTEDWQVGLWRTLKRGSTLLK